MAIVKTEYFDEEVMKPILCDDRFNSKDLKRLSEYNKHRINGGKVNVSYVFGAGCAEHKLGRLFPENGIGLQAFRFDLRNPLAKRWYWDTDIENCHFVIALKYCKDYDLPHENLLYYIENRDNCLKTVSDNRKKAKTEFLKVLYGGNLQLYREDYLDVEGSITQEGRSLLLKVKIEMDALMFKIWAKHSEFHNLKMGKDKKMISKKYNPQASLMSLIFQTKERELIMEWDKYLAEKGRYLSVLIHDGGYISKIEGESEFPNELLIGGSTHLNETLGYTHIKLTQKEINHDWAPKVKPFVKIITDDNDGATILLDELKNSLLYHSSQLFYKHGYLWINDPEQINNYLLDYIMMSGLYKASKKEDEAIPYSQNIKCAENLLKALYVKIKTSQKINIDIYTKLHTTTKGRLCFLDGVLDFKTGKFYTWDKIDFEYFTCVMIKRNFKEYFDNPNLEIVNKIKADIYDNLYGDDCGTALNALSRALAGHCEDKNFMEYVGNRNCGKGILFDNLKSAFGEYVNSFELSYFLYNRATAGSSETAPKLNYWIIDLQFVRLAISQETPSVEKNLKVNGQLWKKLCGGNDDHICKRNYDRVNTTVKIDTTFSVMGNNELVYDTPDTKEHRIFFSSSVQFKKQQDIDKMKANGEDQRIIDAFKVKDDALRDKCLSEEWMNATVYLLFQHYVSVAVSANSQEIDDDDEDDKAGMSIRKVLLSKFDFDKDEVVPAVEVHNCLSQFQKSKIEAELKGLNIIKKKMTTGEYKFKWCYLGISQKECP